MSERLPKAPLREALIELRWKLHQLTPDPESPVIDPAYSVFPGVLFQSIRDYFPHIQRLPASEVPDELTPHVAKQQFRAKPNGWPLIQVGPGIATLNFTTEYTWDSFSTYCHRFFENLLSAYKVSNQDIPPEIQSTTLRYINAVPIADGILEFLREKLHVDVRLPQSIVGSKMINGPLTNLSLGVEYPLERPVGLGILRFATGKAEGLLAIVWDIMIQSTSAVPQDSQAFEQWLREAHDVAESWFFGTVEGDLLQEFRG